GLRATDHPIERAGVELAEEELRAADLVLLLFDASRPWSDDDRQLARRCPSALLVHNKIDRVDSDPIKQTPADLQQQRPEGCFTSALQGRGIEELAVAIGHRLVPQKPPAGEAVPFTKRQVNALHAARKHIAMGERKGATGVLEALISK
ncbi:MAG: hypothetical protein JXM70_30055, partial [Pirellulales bacterium]|nr:hypothetical protein [Pirellulales bacterium]